MSDVVRTLPCSEAQQHFDELLERAAQQKERVVLTKRGKAVAALVPIEDLHLIAAVEDQQDAEDFAKAKEEFERGGEPTTPWEKVKADSQL
jgi:prevent-host-death family protein